ncbi:MAG: trigger factor [Alphaproteobacteria bacterium]
MQVVQTSAEGLKREVKVTVPSADVSQMVEKRLEELGSTVRMPGFRPGKAPKDILLRRFGDSVKGEVLQRLIDETSRQAMNDNNYRPALKPQIAVERFDDETGLEYIMTLEILPDVEIPDLSVIELEKLVALAGDDEVAKGLDKLAEAFRQEIQLEGNPAIENGQLVEIDFTGTVDNKPYPMLSGEGHRVVIGSHRLIGDFEEQLIGVKVGGTKTVTITLPNNLPEAAIAGKEAVFEVLVKAVYKLEKHDLNDDLAKSAGRENLEDLKKALGEQIATESANFSRLRLKRQLLDVLAEKNNFAVPQGMIDIEFEGIWQQFVRLPEHERDEEDRQKTEEQLKADYRAIAERRVRLGLLLNEIGQRHQISITNEQMNHAVLRKAQANPPQARQIIEFFRSNRQAQAQLQAEVYEDAVVDHILAAAKLNEKQVSFEDLVKDVEDIS